MHEAEVFVMAISPQHYAKSQLEDIHHNGGHGRIVDGFRMPCQLLTITALSKMLECLKPTSFVEDCFSAEYLPRGATMMMTQPQPCNFVSRRKLRVMSGEHEGRDEWTLPWEHERRERG